jgi:hypothetical protein
MDDAFSNPNFLDFAQLVYRNEMNDEVNDKLLF